MSDDYTKGFNDGIEFAAAIVEKQDWPMFAQQSPNLAVNSRSWIKDAILKLKKNVVP